MKRSSRPTMLAARLHGPRDLRVERVAHPGSPPAGHVLVGVTATGICGSDLHSFTHARLGDSVIESPLILGHEFAGVIEAVGRDSRDGNFQPLHAGQRVAVDPAQPCGACEMCAQGHPNLCCRLHFCGNYPDQGCLAEFIHMPAQCCFPLPDTISDAAGAMLEPLGVAIHAVDLAKIRVGSSVAILGAGPIGLLILQVARLAGAEPLFVTDKFPWRLKLARRFGAITIPADQPDLVQRVQKATDGRGVDVAIEAAWADQALDQAAALARLGGRLVAVGIPATDEFRIQHSTARRKGLTIVMARRMKHAYPRAIRLVQTGKVDVEALITHRFALTQAPAAFAVNAAYRDRVVKVIIETGCAA